MKSVTDKLVMLLEWIISTSVSSLYVYFPDLCLEVMRVSVCLHPEMVYVLTDTGDLYVWGSDQYGQCAMGGSKIVFTPQKVSAV